MPRMTKETQLPKPAATQIDWERIAASGRVWEFLEGEDFKGSSASFRARKKTEARKVGVDFESVETQRAGKIILKLLAFSITNKPTRATAIQSARAETPPAREPEPQLFPA